MTIPEIKKELDKLGVDYLSKATKSELEALLADAQVDESTEPEVEPVEEPVSVPEVTTPVRDLGEYAGRRIGPLELLIVRSEEKSIPRIANGKPMLHITLEDGTSHVLSRRDVEEQLS